MSTPESDDHTRFLRAVLDQRQEQADAARAVLTKLDADRQVAWDAWLEADAAWGAAWRDLYGEDLP